MSTESFADWFSGQLKRRGWSAADFHRRADVPRPTVYTWVKGTRLPDPASVDVIADVFGLNVDDVLAIAGHRPHVDPIPPDDPRRELVAIAERLDRRKVDMAIRVLRALDESQTGWS